MEDVKKIPTTIENSDKVSKSKFKSFIRRKSIETESVARLQYLVSKGELSSLKYTLEYYIVFRQEDPVTKIMHKYGFPIGIFNKQHDLIMLIDCAYDYSGEILTNEDVERHKAYSENRALSVPENVMLYIITENKVLEGITEIVKLLKNH